MLLFLSLLLVDCLILTTTTMPSMDPKEALLSGFQSEPAPRWSSDGSTNNTSNNSSPSLNRKRYNHGAVVLPAESKILVVGGQEEKEGATLRSVEVLENKKWNKKWPKLNQNRAEHATVLCNNTVVYVMGGYSSNNNECLDSIECLNLSAKTLKWQVLENVTLTSKKRGCAAVAVGNYIHIMGGMQANGNVISSVDVLDTRTNQVMRGVALGTKRYGAACALVERTIYVVGGHNNSQKVLDSIEALHLTDGKPSWQTCAFTLSTPRVFPAITVVSHCLVVVGGRSDSLAELASVEVVDRKRHTVWKLPSLPEARCGCTAVTIKQSRIVVVGGYNSATGIFSSMQVLNLHTLPIQTQITVVERELLQIRRASSSIKSLFGGAKKKNKRGISKSSSLKVFLEELKERAGSQDDNDSWQSSLDNDDDVELPSYDCGRIYAKKMLKDSGQAQVYKGIMEDKGGSPKQTVAIKVFKHRSDWDDCKQELIVLLKMSGHANVMDVLDFYEVPKPAFIMRFVTGGDLRDYLDKKGKLTGKTAMNILHGIGQGLCHLHKNAIVHRDLKSANVVLEKKGKSRTPVLIDLGLGKAVDPDNAMDEFQTVGCLGTACWMAPEMASEGKWSTKTDMYALGVIMWEVLTGDYPYSGMGWGWNQILVYVVRKNGRPDDDGQMNKAKVSKPHQDLVESLWHADPNRRPSAEEFLARLDKL